MSWTLPPSLDVKGNTFTKLFGRLLFKTLGWKAKGQLPDEKKFIIAITPHTSNWDFFVAIAYALGIGIKVSFMGKHSIFVFPVKRLLLALGGIPIDRRKPQGTVEQMVQNFNDSECLVLAIAPEGTRKYIENWKTGFLHISKQAQVPVTLVTLDYKTRTLEFGPNIGISDDIDADLDKIKDLTKRATGKKPGNTSL